MDPGQAAMAKVQADSAAVDKKIQAEQQQSAAELALKKGAMQQENQQFGAQLQMDASTDELDQKTQASTALANEETKRSIADQADQTKLQVTQDDNQTALQITGAKLAEAAQNPASHPGINITNGEGVGKSAPEG